MTDIHYEWDKCQDNWLLQIRICLWEKFFWI